MGTWGADIFQDDLALDIKHEYVEILNSVHSHEVATETVIEHFREILEDPEELCVFWLTIASVQFEYHSLIETVKIRALDVIDNGKDLLRWEGSPDFQNRKKNLQKLKSQILQTKNGQ